MAHKPIPMPKKATTLPDAPRDGIWNVTHRIAEIILKRYKRARQDPNKRITKKELFKEQMNDMISTSDNNIIAKATPKQRKDAFGVFLDNLLEDEQTHEGFKYALATMKDDNPEEYVKSVLQIQKMRHPVDKNINVDIDVKVKQDMYTRMSEQYKYSQMVELEDAEIVKEDNLLPEPKEQVSVNDMMLYAQPIELDNEEDSDSTFQNEITNEED